MTAMQGRMRQIAGTLEDAATLAFWDRCDGFHANDPSAPDLWHCDGCGADRETERAFCPSCCEVTGGYSYPLALTRVPTPRALNERLLTILRADRPMTDDEREYVDACERAAGLLGDEM